MCVYLCILNTQRETLNPSPLSKTMSYVAVAVNPEHKYDTDVDKAGALFQRNGQVHIDCILRLRMPSHLCRFSFAKPSLIKKFQST